MVSKFLLFVWVLIGGVRSSIVRSSFQSVFLEFLAVRAVFNRLFGAFPVRLHFWLVNRELTGEAVVLWSSREFLRRFLLFEFTFLKFFGVYEVLTD